MSLVASLVALVAVAHTEESQSIMSSHKGPFCLPRLGKVFGNEQEAVEERKDEKSSSLFIVESKESSCMSRDTYQ